MAVALKPLWEEGSEKPLQDLVSLNCKQPLSSTYDDYALLNKMCTHLHRPIVRVTNRSTGSGQLFQVNESEPIAVQVDLATGRVADVPVPMRPILLLQTPSGTYNWLRYVHRAEPNSREVLRLSRRGGVKRAAAGVHGETVGQLRGYLRRVLRTCISLMEGQPGNRRNSRNIFR